MLFFVRDNLSAADERGTMQQIDVDIKDAYLEALKAQEHQAHEDFLLNPSSEFLQKELSTAREALRSYILYPDCSAKQHCT